MKCYYHNDADGRCAGAIVFKWWQEKPKGVGEIEFIEMDYHNEIDLSKIEKDEMVIIVDFSFPVDTFRQLLEKTDHVIWIDHHKTLLVKYPAELLKSVRGYRSIEHSGCELAWKFFFVGQDIPLAVAFIGDRDTWKWEYGKLTAWFNLGLQTITHLPQDTNWSPLLSPQDPNPFVTSLVQKGETCEKFRDQFCSDYLSSYGFETVFEGYTCIALNFMKFGSEVFGDSIKKYRICVSFCLAGEKWIVRLYSENIDVSEIAKKYGGGGHKGAAGFTCDTLPFKKEDATNHMIGLISKAVEMNKESRREDK